MLVIHPFPRFCIRKSLRNLEETRANYDNNRMRVYAALYISELAGFETLKSQSRWDQYFDYI